MSKTIGEILKELRVEKDISQETIARSTNLSVKKLESLENNAFSQFPGKFYYINYIKEYLKVVGYDQKSFFNQYRGLINSTNFKESNPQVQFSRINYERFKRKKFLFILLLFLVLLIILGAVFLIAFKGKLDLKNILGNLTKILQMV